MYTILIIITSKWKIMTWLVFEKTSFERWEVYYVGCQGLWHKSATVWLLNYNFYSQPLRQIKDVTTSIFKKKKIGADAASTTIPVHNAQICQTMNNIFDYKCLRGRVIPGNIWSKVSAFLDMFQQPVNGRRASKAVFCCAHVSTMSTSWHTLPKCRNDIVPLWGENKQNTFFFLTEVNK